MVQWLLDHLWPVLVGGGGAALLGFFRRRIFKWGRNEVALGYCREDLETANNRITKIKEDHKNQRMDFEDSCADYCAQLMDRTPSKPS